MTKIGKQFAAAKAKVEQGPYTLDEGLPLLKSLTFAKFDETVEMAMRLGVNPKHADQMVRGTVLLPHGLGRTKNVVVIAGPTGRRKRGRRAPIRWAARSWWRKSPAGGSTSTRWSRRPT